MTQPVVGIVGARALRKDLDRLASDVNGPLFNAMKRAGYHAVQPIVPATRAALPKQGTGRLAGSVRASAYRSGAAVRMGKSQVPYAGWIEFGGRRPDGSNREYRPGGRYLFPAARDLAADAAKDYSAALEQLFGSSGIWTNTTTNPGSVHD